MKTSVQEFFVIPSNSGYGMFLYAGLITCGPSICTYTIIERPFSRKAGR